VTGPTRASEAHLHHVFAGVWEYSGDLRAELGQCERVLTLIEPHNGPNGVAHDVGNRRHAAFFLVALGDCYRIAGREDDARQAPHSGLYIHQVDPEGACFMALAWCGAGPAPTTGPAPASTSPARRAHPSRVRRRIPRPA
jgi:hypothetical protein